jgi:hypothetical protein
MTHDEEPKQKLDKSSESDSKSSGTTAKVANESVTDETQAARYEPKFQSFSSSSDKVQPEAQDSPLLALMSRVNKTAEQIGQGIGQAVAEFMIEDRDKGVQVTARGDRQINPDRLNDSASADASSVSAASPEHIAAPKEYHGVHAIMRAKTVTSEISAATKLDAVYRAIDEHPYAGESMLRGEEIGGTTHKCLPGETLVSLAEKHLGPGMDRAKYESYAREVQHVNHLHDGHIQPDMELVLPAHHTNGAFVVGNKWTFVETFKDGKQVFKHINGRDFQRTPTADGGCIEHHSGVGQSDTFVLKRSNDGTYSVAEEEGAPFMHASRHPDVRVAHAELHRLAEQHIHDPGAHTKFEADMIRFENRAQKRGLSNQEVIDTYKSIERLMNEKEPEIPHGLRIQVAEEIMSQAAEPRSVCQGSYNTCNVSTVEALLYTKEPARAADSVVDVAIAGKFKRPGGPELQIDDQSIQPHGEAFLNGDDTRSYASQLFAVTALRLVYSMDSSGDTSGKRYVQDEPWVAKNPGDKPPSPLIDPDDDNGERLYDKSGKLIDIAPDTGVNEIILAHQLITGRQEKGVLIAHTSDSGTNAHLDQVSSEQDLYKTLLKYKNDLPIIIAMDTGGEPFFTDSGGGDAGGAGGGHVITITKFVDGKPPMVAVDNQWDVFSDHREANLRLRDLYLAMESPEKNYAKLNEIVAHNRKIDQVDTATELDLERVQRLGDTEPHKDIADMKFGWEVARRYAEAEKRWTQQRVNGTFNQSEYDRAQAKLDQLKTHSFSAKATEAYNQGNVGDKDRAARVAAIRAGKKP